MTFDEFAGARLPALLRFATALTGDPDLAKDLVQEVLLRASGRWQQVGQLDRPEAYVRKMVVNEYLSWRRRSWRLIPSGTDSHLAGRPSPDPAGKFTEADNWYYLAPTKANLAHLRVPIPHGYPHSG
jgi:DNA-directed RNA polymerase specialized sigma24 family protein